MAAVNGVTGPAPQTGEEMESEHFSPYRSDGKLYGFVCIVIGATQPVGLAVVNELAAHGAACVYACSDSSTTDSAASSSLASQTESLRATYPNTRIIPYPYAYTDESESLALIDDILNQWGRLDIWITSSGLLGPPSISDTSPVDIQRVISANALPAFFALKYGPAAMGKTTPKGNYPNAAPKDVKYGSIIVISSVATAYGGCWGPAFTMSSHAALGLVRSGVATLKGSGVRINCISAGQIDVGVKLEGSDMRGMSAQLPPASLQSESTQKSQIGLERAGYPAEVAKVVGFLASGFSSYITGANLVVDGGATEMNPLTVPL